MYKKILVPLDGSEASEGALPHAQALAKQFGAELELISVVVPTMMGDPSMSNVIEKEEVGEETSYLNGKVAELAKAGFKASAKVAEGLITDAILHAQVAEGVDLIVMATHGRSGLKHLLLGSVAESVVRTAKVPVMLVRIA